MSTYKNDQFYGWKNYESLDPTKRNSNDNPQYLWPSSVRRNSIDGTTKPVKRGYMRALTEALPGGTASAALKQLGASRLFFQFNPDTITRSVEARNDVQYWMNMDPIQLTQPMPGTINFAFELLFNREAEVASGKVEGGGTVSVRAANAQGYTTVSTIPNAQNPAVVGVLADLYKFDQIIGQGINQASIEAFVKNAIAMQNKNVQNSKKKSSSSSQEDTNNATKDDEDIDPVVEPLSDADQKLIRENLALNVGNSAFLVANPIRIVFSSLFMVEGYVTNASVVFNKFNPSMVPTQCVVSVNMQALYIGFAKKDTFLTYNAKKVEEALAEQEGDEAEEKARQDAEQSFAQAFADKGFSKKNETIETKSSLIRSAYDLVDQDGRRLFYTSLQPSKDLLSAIKDGQISKITATAVWTVQYKGNTSSIPANSYAKDTKWEGTSNVDLDLSNLKKAYKFEFDRPSLTIGKLFDKTATSIYTTTVKITFNYTTGNGTTVESKQTINWTATADYEQSTGKKAEFGKYYILSNGNTEVQNDPVNRF